MQRILGRTLGATALLGLAFVGGVSFQDLASARSAASLRTALTLMPDRIHAALLTAASGQGEDATPYQTYADVLTTLKANYYGKDIDPTQMTYNGISGMMNSVHDRYTFFLTPKAYKDMMDENHGEFVGIGAQLSTNKQGQVYIQKVLPNSPALRAHVMNGDVILKVNGKAVLKTQIDDVVKQIRGEPDTKVLLTLLRKGAAKPLTLAITRDVVQQPLVQSSMLDPVSKIGYIHLNEFSETSDAQINKALTALQNQGMRGLVFDLRDNPGGLLDVAQEIASRFIPPGPVVWIKNKTETQETMESLDVDASQKNHLRFPLVVLVNGDSASAAEIVSGAIKDTHAGVLVGEKTFGKGVVQTVFGLPDGSAARITTQHYYTAKKNDINHKGIEPDITVKNTDDDLRKASVYLLAHPDAFYDLKDDRQLQTAASVLRRQMQVASARPW